MNKSHTEYWLTIADNDMKVARDLYKMGHWLYVAFMCHQVIEKTLKGYWEAIMDVDPPYTHSHQRLADETGLTELMSEEQKRFISSIASMNIEARYPSYKAAISAELSKESCKSILERTEELRQWIIEKL